MMLCSWCFYFCFFFLFWKFSFANMKKTHFIFNVPIDYIITVETSILRNPHYQPFSFSIPFFISSILLLPSYKSHFLIHFLGTSLRQTIPHLTSTTLYYLILNGSDISIVISNFKFNDIIDIKQNKIKNRTKINVTDST